MKIFQIILVILIINALINQTKSRQNKKLSIRKYKDKKEIQNEDSQKDLKQSIRQMKKNKKIHKDKIQEARERAKKVKQSSKKIPNIQKITKDEFEAKAAQFSQQPKDIQPTTFSQEQQHQLIDKYFAHVLWGSVFTQNNDDFEIFNQIGLQGIFPDDEFMEKAKRLGIDLNDFNNFGTDKSNEKVYTGVIEFDNSEQPGSNYQPFVGCGLQENNIEQNTTTEKNNSTHNHDEL